MSRLRTIELIEPSYFDYPSFCFREASIFTPRALALPSLVDLLEQYECEYDLGLDLVRPSPFELFDCVTDLIRIDQRPSISTYRRIQRVERLGGDVVLQSLSDRVSKLESRFDRLLKINGGGGGRDRKYTWTAEIKGPAKRGGVDRKYQWEAEIKGGKKEEEGIEKKTYKWTAEIEGKGADGGPISRTYTLKASSGGGECSESKKKDKHEKKDKSKKKGQKENDTRLVEIEEVGDHGAVALRQAFAKRFGASASAKGKKKELSPQDAALMIQMSFRAYLIRRSKALRALRELAVAKSKLKELRALFNNFSYRRRVTHDAEERQRFSEKIIVLLLTVDAIEGSDLMVRSAKKSMVDELEAMLDVVDPKPPGPGKSLSIRRRTFDMPDAIIQQEIAAGVAEVVQMLNQEENAIGV